MKINEIQSLLESTGFFTGYNELDPKELKGPLRPPYIFFTLPGSNNFFADGVSYQIKHRVSIELYTAKKDPAAQHKLEQVLTLAGIGWQRVSEVYISSERLYQNIYESELIFDE